MMNRNAIWYQSSERRNAQVFDYGGTFRYEIYDLWIGRFDVKVPGTLLYSGFRETLEQAKKTVFELL